MHPMRALPALLLAALVLAGCQSETVRAFEKAAAELPAAEAEARRLGLPLAGQDLRPNLPVPAEQNAAEPIRAAINALARAEAAATDWQKVLGQAAQDPTPENLSEARRVLQTLDPALRLAEEAAARPSVDFGRDWSTEPAYKILFPEYAGMKSLVKAMALRGAVRASAGEPASAVTMDFHTAFRLARLAGSDPVLIAGLVQVACEAIVLRAMETAATARAQDSPLLAAMRRLASEHAQPRPDLTHHLRGEVLMALSSALDLRRLADDLQKANEEVGEASMRQVRELLPGGCPIEVVQKAYRARALQAWSEAYSRPEELRDSARAGKWLEAVQRRHTDEKDPTLALNRVVFPVFSAAGDAYARRDASFAAFQSLARILEFRAQHGRWPKDLPEAGAVATDPFDGQPLRYRADGESARVYSVGPDRKDDGGEEGRRADRRDVVAIYPRRTSP